MGIRVSNVTGQVLFISTEILQSVSDTITFVQEPFARKLRVSNLTIQILQLESGRLTTASNTMSLLDLVVAVNSAGDRQIIEDVISFTDSAIVPSHPIIEQVLEFTQTVRPSIWDIDVAQMLFLNQFAATCVGAPWGGISLSDTLAFSDTASRTETASASNAITFSDSAEQVWSTIGDGHFIDFQQSVSVGIGYNASSTLEFAQSIQSFSDFLRSVTDADVVEHALTFYIDNPCNRKQYARFVGEGSASAIDEEGFLFDSAFVLESIEDGTVLILRSPESDDTDRIGFNRINRETRGGELNVYSDPVWAEVNTLLFTITALPDGDGSCPDTLSAVLQFMQDNLGEEIFLHDWTGVSWRGVITQPDEAATEDDDGYWTITFEFEGIPQDGSVPNSVMDIQQNLSFNADWVRGLADTLSFEETVTVGGDINVSVEHTLGLTDNLVGSEHEIDVMFEDMSSGTGTLPMDGDTPDTGTDTWRAHTDILDDGTTSSPIDAGAYYPVTLVDDTRYQLTLNSAFMNAYNDGDSGIFGFFEDISSSNSISGPVADGTLNPTCAKAVHLMREVDGGTRNNAYRRGSESDGAADTVQWTDASLRASADATLDLRIIIDTTGGAGNWTATWYAKSTLSSDFTEVGPETALLSENIGAVGWSMDSTSVDAQVTSNISFQELRPVT